MKPAARAPGKVVLSGAYAVLEGAPAIVAAVDRYAVADASRPPEFVTPEVRAAIGDATAPWFDASGLREGGQKLGLGSSAAILVASLASLEIAQGRSLDEPARQRLFEQALVAHRAAQGGGSGIDVAAAVFGGVLVAQKEGQALAVRHVELPPIHIEIWAASVPASTASMLGRVRTFREAEPARYSSIISDLSRAAERAVAAVKGADARALLEALEAQRTLLRGLGLASSAPIVTDEVEALSELGRADAAVVMPAGAGGGDVVIYAGLGPPESTLFTRARELGHRRLDLTLGARGVHEAEP